MHFTCMYMYIFSLLVQVEFAQSREANGNSSRNSRPRQRNSGNGRGSGYPLRSVLKLILEILLMYSSHANQSRKIYPLRWVLSLSTILRCIGSSPTLWCQSSNCQLAQESPRNVLPAGISLQIILPAEVSFWNDLVDHSKSVDDIYGYWSVLKVVDAPKSFLKIVYPQAWIVQ